MKNICYLTLIFLLSSFLGFTQNKLENIKTLWTANWSHDGNYIAVGGDDKIIRIYNGKSFELLKTYPNESEIKRLRWHPEKSILAVAAEGNHSKLIDVNSDTVIEFNDIETTGSRAIEWNHSGELIALGDFEGKLFILNNKGELIHTITKKNTITYVGVDWHPNKNEIITLSGKIRVFNTNGDQIKTFNHREENILLLCVKWHPSGDFFVVGDYGDMYVPHTPLLQFWNRDYSLMTQRDVSNSEFRNISWNHKGNRLATASDALRIWNKKGELLYTGISEDNLWGIDWSPNSKYIVTSSGKGQIIIWNKKGRKIATLEK